MNRPNRLLVGVCLLLTGALAAYTSVSVLEAVSVLAWAVSMGWAVSGLGRRVIIPELMALLATTQLLLIPVLFYAFWPDQMAVSAERYLRYTCPAVVAFGFGLWLTALPTAAHQTALASLRQNPNRTKHIGIRLLMVGVLGAWLLLQGVAPLRTVAEFGFGCAGVGGLYVYAAGGRGRWSGIAVSLGLLLAVTVRNGMFGALFYWVLLWGLYVAALDAWTPRRKVLGLGMAVGLLLLIQSVKFDYRLGTWGGVPGQRRSDPALLNKLLLDRIANPNKILNERALWSSATRLNQGALVAAVMAHVPLHRPHAPGEVLKSFGYPFIPRLLWPNKPQTGGYENIRHYTSLPQYANNSFNISPVGEAYISFGAVGGVLFMLAYGWLFGSLFRWFFRMSTGHRQRQLLWLPLLFIGSISMETDLYTTWGTLVLMTVYYEIARSIAAYTWPNRPTVSSPHAAQPNSHSG